jgi:putative glycosyltransferase (TIGR04372 family)
MFKKPVLIVNLVPLMDIASWVDGITVPKRLFWNNGKELTLTEHLDNRNVNQYKVKGINVVDLSPNEIKSAVQEMNVHLQRGSLSNKQVQIQNKFWSTLERHDLYEKYHGVRNPNALFSSSFLESHPNFLS